MLVKERKRKGKGCLCLMCSQKEQGLTNRSSRKMACPSPDMHHAYNSLTMVVFNRKEKNKSKNKHSEQDNLIRIQQPLQYNYFFLKERSFFKSLDQGAPMRVSAPFDQN